MSKPVLSLPAAEPPVERVLGETGLRSSVLARRSRAVPAPRAGAQTTADNVHYVKLWVAAGSVPASPLRAGCPFSMNLSLLAGPMSRPARPPARPVPGRAAAAVRHR